ncbi:MAG: DUF3592 domain-containing protein [Prosthecobacter sp.]|uniref:DUF3592 domain-containing protein n=1 Tax=Prosthecobacter sp. TaxID=1965333 RepID=UPI0025D90C4B|nr:DUF3592 domain-containing protein [Prosthecobacter sp.]MCF7786138.1 DUF3592 domain-containing protein [Prosthecobacter sp.]
MLRPIRSSARSAKKFSGGCAVLFGLPFILAGLAIGAFTYFPAIGSWWSARGWEEVPCWIESAELKSSTSDEGGTSYSVTASYRYDFDRRRYHGDEVSFLGGSDNIGDFQEQAFQQIKALEGKDQPFRCFVNPSKPEQAVLFRELRWGLLLIISIFPTIFPLVGFVVSIGGWLHSRKERLNQKLKAQHPDEPWRWRTEWVGDTIHSTKDYLPFILGIAGWILAIQLPLAFAVVFGGELAKSALAVFALLPSLLALIPLRIAWKRVKSRLAFGHPSLQLKRFPAGTGSALEGDLRFDRVLSPMSSISVRVLCQRHITRRSGNSQMWSKETIWEHKETLSAAEARRDSSGVALPLRIEIPRGLPGSVEDQASFTTTNGERHEWLLEVSSSQGGKPSVLPLPMFADKDEGGESTAIAPVVTVDLSTEDLVSRLQARGINAEFDSDGIPTVLDCPAGRNRSTSWFLLLFGSIWFAAFVVMTYQGAPLIFRLIWGITSPLILGTGLWTLLQSRRVEINSGELRILNRIGPFYSWRETFEPRHFVGFVHDTNMQSGSQFYYRVRGETIFDQKKTLIDGVVESVTAETMAKRLEQWRKRVVTK